ncbi:MAG: DUF6734 family protein [archaeon]
MRAFHAHWTKPQMIDGKLKNEDYDILMTILSALNWKKYMGEIKLYTDTKGIELYEKYGILDIWNDIDINTLNNIPDTIDTRYWAAGKLIALEQEPLGSVSIDRDFIIWDDINNYLSDSSVIGAHFENKYDFYYNHDDYDSKGNYYFGEYFDIYINPINTSLCIIRNQDIKDLYISEFLRFINSQFNVPNNKRFIELLLFAEQAILPMITYHYNKDIHTVFDQKKPYFENKKITHIWGFKTVIKNSESLKQWFYRNMLLRLKKDYPEYYERIIDINQTYKKYHDELYRI